MSSSALKILSSFFLDLRFLKGHLDWHIGTLSRTDCVFLRFEDERRRNAYKNDDMESHYYLLRECMSSHDDCLSRHRASVRCCVILFF